MLILLVAAVCLLAVAAAGAVLYVVLVKQKTRGLMDRPKGSDYREEGK